MTVKSLNIHYLTKICRQKSLFCTAFLEMHIPLGLLSGEDIIRAGSLRADRSGGVGEGSVDGDDVALLSGDVRAERELRVRGGHRLFVFRLHARGHPGRLELAGDHPAADFIQQQGLYAAMQRVHPSLIVGSGLPVTDDVISVFEEVEVESERMVGRTTDAVVARCSCPRVDNLFHNECVFRNSRTIGRTVPS